MEFRFPKSLTRADNQLWTPDGVEYIQSWKIGESGEDGKQLLKHEFKLTYRGEEEFFGIAAHVDDSDAHIEDLAAWTAEHSMAKIIEKLRERGSKLVPEALADKENWDARRDLAAIFRDFKKSQAKRRNSSTGKLYFAGIQIAKS